MTSVQTDLPVRYCHGCGKWDDHPRVQHIADRNNPALDGLYHYDCLPETREVGGVVHNVRAAHAADVQPGIDACAAGKRGQDVRDVMAAHAASITEAPADTQEA